MSWTGLHQYQSRRLAASLASVLTISIGGSLRFTGNCSPLTSLSEKTGFSVGQKIVNGRSRF